MQAILMLAVVGVAAAALGTGFLGNEIELWIQQFGVGTGVIETPIDHVQVDFILSQIPNPDTNFPNTFLNVLDCELFLAEDIGQLIGSPVNPNDPNGPTVDKDSELTCKFTDENRQIINEVTMTSTQLGVPNPGIIPAGTYVLPIGEDVRNVHDVVVVVHANTYNVGDFEN